MIMRNCLLIDEDIKMLRHEPGLLDDTDQCNLFPMILSSNCHVRIDPLKRRDFDQRKLITETEIFDAIVQIDFQNKHCTENGP